MQGSYRKGLPSDYILFTGSPCLRSLIVTVRGEGWKDKTKKRLERKLFQESRLSALLQIKTNAIALAMLKDSDKRRILYRNCLLFFPLPYSPQQRRKIGDQVTPRAYYKLYSVPGAPSLLLLKCRRANNLHFCNPILSYQSALQGGKGGKRKHKSGIGQVTLLVMAIM